MFTRSYLPYQPLTLSASPFAGVGGIFPTSPQMIGYNPLLSVLTPQVSYNPILPQIGHYGFNPYQAVQLTGGIPVPAAALPVGVNPFLNPSVNPAIGTQLSVGNPAIVPNFVPQGWGGSYASPIHSLFHQAGGDIGFLGSPLLGQPLIGGLNAMGPSYTQASPYVVQEPSPVTMLAQPFNPLTQARLPIRPLIAIDPLQAGVSGFVGVPAAQMVDPFGAFPQTQLASPCVISPIQPMGRTYTVANWASIPPSIGQPSPIGQVAVPTVL